MHFVKTLIKQFFLEDLVVWRKIMAETFFETMFDTQPALSGQRNLLKINKNNHVLLNVFYYVYCQLLSYFPICVYLIIIVDCYCPLWAHKWPILLKMASITISQTKLKVHFFSWNFKESEEIHIHKQSLTNLYLVSFFQL
jgi:hypothetical protein